MAALAPLVGVSSTAAGAATVGTMVAATGASLVGSGISAYGMIRQGKAEQQALNLQARIDDNNAIRAGYAAIQEREQAEREVKNIREQRDRVLSQNITAAAKSGLQISGSVVDVMGDSAIQFEKEIQMARYRGDVGAYNYASQASDFRDQASLRRMQGRATRRSSRWSAAGTFLGGAGSAGLNYASFRGT